MKNARTYLLTLIVGLTLSACGGDSGTTSSDGSFPIPERDDPSTPTDPVGRAPSTGGNFLSSRNTVNGLMVSGGVAIDNIPALTDPAMVGKNHSDADYIAEKDLVTGIVINGDSRAYPHNIGGRHEIINDVVGGQPLVISFCPLTGTGMVFDGLGADGSRITCGVSGLLFNNNLVMYDRRDARDLSTMTLYPQMLGVSTRGAREGNELNLLPVVETTWRYWKTLYPETLVVGGNRDDDASVISSAFLYGNREYTTYPYPNYREPLTSPLFSSSPSLSDNPTVDLFNLKDIVLGVRFGELAKAYPFRAMTDEAVINDTVAGNDIAIVYHAEEKMALPFSREFSGQTLTFDRIASTDTVFPYMIRDQQTQTTWDLLGCGIDGPNAGQQLTQIPGHNAFWFAWATFWQNTGVL
jgi:hypothetical protein